MSKKAINYKKGWWFKDASDTSRACLYKLKIIFVWLIWDHYHSFKMVNNVRGGVLLLVCFEGYHSVASYQQHSLRNIAVPHRCFSLSTYSFSKFNTASRVFFTRSHLKHIFLKNFVCIILLFSEGLYTTFLVFSKYLDCWYDSKQLVN